MHKRSLLWFLVFVIAFLYGALFSRYEIFPYKLLKTAHMQYLQFGKSEIANDDTGNDFQTLDTNLFPFKMSLVPLPETKNEILKEYKITSASGAFASLRENVLMLDSDGSIYHIGEGVIDTGLSSPPNNLKSYREFSSREIYSHMRGPRLLRYHDIIAFDFKDQEYLVVSYIEWIDEKKCYANTLSKILLGASGVWEPSSEPAGDWETLYQTKPCLPLKTKGNSPLEYPMGGGRMDYLEPGKIVFGSGDFYWDGYLWPTRLAQDDMADYGKVLMIDVDTGNVNHISKGHRNTQGVLVDSSNRIWVTEHGPRGGDELNLVEDGGNYGWPLETFGTLYSKAKVPTTTEYGRHDNYTAPFMSWVPSIGISSIDEVRGLSNAWNNDLLIVGLASQKLYRLRVQENHVSMMEEIKIGGRLRDVHVHTNGLIYVLTDNRIVKVLKLMSDGYEVIDFKRMLTEFDYLEDELVAIEKTFDGCLECHDLVGNNSKSQSLALMHGNRSGWNKYEGKTHGYASDALASKNINWNTDNLKEFLSDPQKYIPGTNMPNQRIENKKILLGVVTVLEKLSEEYKELY